MIASKYRGEWGDAMDYLNALLEEAVRKNGGEPLVIHIDPTRRPTLRLKEMP